MWIIACVADSCKFLHDRSDYKHGWQLEREAEHGSPARDEGCTVMYYVSGVAFIAWVMCCAVIMPSK